MAGLGREKGGLGGGMPKGVQLPSRPGSGFHEKLGVFQGLPSGKLT